MSLLELLKKRIDQEPNPWDEYAKILKRHEKPKATDGDRLFQLVKELGLDPREPEVHIQAIKEMKAARREASGRPAAEKRHADALAQIDQLHANRAEIGRQIGVAHDQRNEAEAAIDRIVGFEGQLDHIGMSYPQLFGIDAEPIAHEGSATIAEKRRELGLPEPTRE